MKENPRYVPMLFILHGGSSSFNFIRYECVMCSGKVAVFLLFIFLSLGGAAFTVFLKVFFKINFIGNDFEQWLE